MMRMGTTAAVAGASGYAGGELLRLIVGHPHLRLGPVAANTQAGQPVTSVHPQLPGLADVSFVATEAATLAQADLVFLALPHGQSAALVAQLPADLPIIDLGADFRLVDADAWTTYYAGPHAGTWPYGLPELPGARAGLERARRIANPGCHATAVAIGLAPLLRAGLVEAQDIVVVAASGTSGAGRTPTAALLASEVMGALSPYKVGGVHQHTPEMEQSLSTAAGEPVILSFTPTLAPMPRGILATSTARLIEGVTTRELQATLHAAYGDEPFVHVLPDGQWPTTAATNGSNAVHVQVAADQHSGRAVVVTALDNLMKGAAGQAVQNANLCLGFDETAGLTAIGVAP
jgi:N-acetyl-gamma-glutamyl-phosphate reductase